MKKYMLKGLFSDVLLGLGFIFTTSPIFLYWFIHGNYDRYIWIINGPYPFRNFGGGPFQLFMYVGLSIVGLGLVTISMILKRSMKNKS